MGEQHHTPVQLSGGAGFDFEDAIGARLLLSMLLGEAYFGAQYGVSKQVDFQVGESGWLLDDLLLTCQKPDSELTRVATSVKIPRHITTAGGFNATFTKAVWAQWTATGEGPFEPNRDLLCLASANVANSVLKAWHELQDEALALEGEPQRLLRRVGKTKVKDAIFSSLMPDPAAFPNVDAVEVVALFRGLRLLRFDFNRETSADTASAVVQCRTLLVDELDRRAEDLWEALKSIAGKHRKVGGSINLAKLVRLLIDAGFRLDQHPSFANDWRKLQQLSDDAQAQIRSYVGNDVQLPRPKARARLQELLNGSDTSVVLGPSGVGKSALLAQEYAARSDTTVWLNAGHFQYSSGAAQQTALSLEHSLGEILGSSTAADNLLIIDAIEAFSPSDLALLGEVLRNANKGESGQWTVVLSCQTHAWDNVRGSLDADCGLRPTVHELGTIEVADVDRLLTACGVTQFQNDATAMQLFGNLKILDWEVRALGSRPTEVAASASSLESIVDVVWQYWIGTETRQHANTKLLHHLGVEQTLSFSKGTAIDSLDYAALELLPSLENRDVIRIDNDAVYFAHDLIGDWVRFRALISLEDTDAELRARVDNPIWHPAIRLFGQSLLDAGNDAEESWQALQQRVRDGSTQGDIVGDLLLDSVFFHPSAYAILTKLRGLFMETNTALFQRLAKRFLLVATVADPRAAGLTNEDDLRLLLEAKMRVPLWSRWWPMLRFLADNARDVASLTPQSVASICATWLQHAPVKTEQGTAFPLRDEAARVALALAREAQLRNLGGAWFQGKDKPFYEAALLAAADLPDAVGRFALEMSQRRPIDTELQDRLAAHEEKKRLARLEDLKNAPQKQRKSVPHMPGPFRGDRLDPWPDGPAERVDDTFREAAWSGGGLKGLIDARPRIAKEVVLALCISEPGYEYDNDGSLLTKSGFTYWRSSFPDAYFNGPFLHFLQSNRDVALDLILELVNFATDRWRDQGLKHNPDAEPPYLAFPINGKEVRWIGNSRVYGWFRGGGGAGCPVNCALMALEYWLYEQLTAESDVLATIEIILGNSRSIAFAAVLNAVGKKHPQLFKGPLQPLLGAAGVYELDRVLVMNNDTSTIGAFSWAQHGEVMFDLLRNWHALEHRRFDLRDIAQRLLVAEPDMQAFFTNRIDVWAQDGSAHEFLCAQLDIRNYTATTSDDGTIGWTLSYPERLEVEANKSLQDNQWVQWLIGFPYTCQQLMDANHGIALDQVDSLACTLQEVSDLPENSDPFVESKKPDAILAGFCVLLRHHKDWLSENPEFKSWGEAYLSNVMMKPPQAEDFDSPYAINTTGWDAWAGQCAVLKLAEHAESEQWRAAVAASVMAPHYTTTGIVLQMAFDHRDVLGDDFSRLLNLAKLWSAVELIWGRQEHFETLRRRRAQLALAFVERKIPATPMSLERIASGSRRLQTRRRIREYRPFANEDVTAAEERIRQSYIPGLNSMLVLQAMSWLPIQLADLDEVTRAIVDREYQDLQAHCLASAPSDSEENANRAVPGELITWWLIRVAVLSMRLDSSVAEQFWRPIMELGIGAHYWVDSFVSSWFLEGVKYSSSPAAFAKRWQALIEYALASPTWHGQGYRDYRRCRTVYDVMGFRAGASVVGDAAYKSEVAALKDHYEQWASLWLQDNEAANAFAAFLTRPSASAIVPDGINWLSDAVTGYSDYSWREQGLASNLAMVLQRGWKDHRKNIIAPGQLRDAFFSLLSLLVKRQDEAAILLQREVGEVD